MAICHTPIELSSAIQAITACRINQRGYELSSDYLIEEFIQGDKYSAEAYWDTKANRWEILGITKKHTTTGQYSVEIGHDFPCEFPLFAKIKTTLISWLNHIGLSHTVAHVEFKNLSQKDFIPDDDGTGKMQHCLVIFDLFLPAGENTPKAIHPTVCSLYNPAVGLKIRVFDGF
ncbi:ATP-grasp domain-containing protein [Providencia stuartii]